jgi:hypothetical protein
MAAAPAKGAKRGGRAGKLMEAAAEVDDGMNLGFSNHPDK